MKIDFYVLDTASRQKSHLFACGVLEKMYTEQRLVYVYTHTREEAERFDALLWTYRDDSFLPHQLHDPATHHTTPILIGDGEAPDGRTVLLNLNPIIPPFFKQFEHVIEIVFTDPLVQQLARERYKLYRDHGYEINTIKLKAE